MKTVIFVYGAEKFPDRRRLAGLSEYARRRGWSVQSVEALRSASQLREVVRLWRPDGFVVSCGAGLNSLPERCYGGVPVVFSRHPGQDRSVRGNCVFNDAKATVALAAKELLSLNLADYAYVGWLRRTGWSDERRRELEALMSLHGRRLHVFEPSARRCMADDLAPRLAAWLAGLPRPVGVLAANDQIAEKVASACRLASLAVPDDVAVLGIDNNEEMCEGCDPSLSSIDLDFDESGRLAGAALDRLMSDPKAAPSHTVYPPLRLVRRKSTHRFTRRDAAVERAVERIRREACAGLSAADVVRDFPCSRRMAEMRFRAAVGRSILREIRRVRLETARRLLAQRPPLAMDAVAARCGYGSLAAFSTFFRRETGRPPSLCRTTVSPPDSSSATRRRREASP